MKPKIWQNGSIVSWEDATIHASSECVLKGSNVFEGIRAYWSDDSSQLNVFRMEEHLDRLFDVSMRFLRMQSPYSRDEIADGIIQLLAINEFRENVHIRPVVYFDDGPDYAVTLEEISVGAFILALPRRNNPQLQAGISSIVSPWRRMSDTSQPSRIKAGANYLNARVAAVDARQKGADLPILLNEFGRVCEGPNACVFMLRRGELVTPSVNEGILESVTRATVLELARDRIGVAPIERSIEVSELYSCDELFFAGTGAELLPIVELDRYQIGHGKPGPLTRSLQDAYFAVVHGKDARYEAWLSPVF